MAHDAAVVRNVVVVRDVARVQAPDTDAADDAGAGLRLRPTVALPEAVPYTGPVDVVATPNGAVVVFVRPTAGRRADIVAQRLDAEGAPVGPPRRLRTTTGPVTALDADLRGGRLWVAWVANPGGDPDADDVLGEQLVVALAVTADLGAASQPVRMLDESIGTRARAWPFPVVEVLARADGGAVVVSHTAPSTCAHAEHDGEESAVPCPGWAWHTVGPEGRVETQREGMLAGTAPPFSLVPTREGAAVLVGNDHVGDKVHLRAYPETSSLDGTYWNVQSPRLATVADTTYFFGRYSPDNGDDVRPRVQVWAPGLGATWRATEAVVTGHALRCVDGRPLVRVSWAGGGVTLDPANPRARFDLARHLPDDALPTRVPALAWAGRVLVGADPAHGTLQRWRCEGASLRTVGADAHDDHPHGAAHAE